MPSPLRDARTRHEAMPAVGAASGRRRPRRAVVRRGFRVLLVVGTLFAVSAASIALALRLTPDQSVSALGQTVDVGAAPPSLSTSGPGQVVLFGQPVSTGVDFIGPVRPRLVLTDISINEQVARLLASGSQAETANALGSALASGWKRYFVLEIAIAGVAALLLFGAIAGWRRYSWKKTLVTLLGGLLFVEAVNLTAIMVTAFTAPGVLRGVHSLSELVGRTEELPLPAVAGPPQHRFQAVVIGDSTAAGLGGPPPADASPSDTACQRSANAFADVLARVNDWKVQNLACSGATIQRGILGPQFEGGRTLPPQLAAAKRADDARAVVVSVGANDMQWNAMIRLCAIADTCDNRALTAYFQRSLDRFAQDYYELLRQLVALPGRPRVLINQYYVPFDPAQECLAPAGLTTDKIEVLLERLGALNAVLANGAHTFGYRTVQPDFAGHELCTNQPYVQGLEDAAPLHPNARGQLVIALADERALLGAR
jgi:lysophospholipase L1-like esterase